MLCVAHQRGALLHVSGHTAIAAGLVGMMSPFIGSIVPEVPSSSGRCLFWCVIFFHVRTCRIISDGSLFPHLSDSLAGRPEPAEGMSDGGQRTCGEYSVPF